MISNEKPKRPAESADMDERQQNPEAENWRRTNSGHIEDSQRVINHQNN